MTNFFFKSGGHRVRFLTALEQERKVFDGLIDPEYAAAFYILTADLSTWEDAKGYITRNGIDFPALLEEVDFSGAYSNLIKLAANLFNESVHVDPIELYRLDESNFTVALTALLMRRKNHPLSAFRD